MQRRALASKRTLIMRPHSAEAFSSLAGRERRQMNMCPAGADGGRVAERRKAAVTSPRVRSPSGVAKNRANRPGGGTRNGGKPPAHSAMSNQRLIPAKVRDAIH